MAIDCWTMHDYRLLDYAWLSIVGLCMPIDYWTMHCYQLIDYAWLSIIGLYIPIDFLTMHTCYGRCAVMLCRLRFCLLVSMFEVGCAMFL